MCAWVDSNHISLSLTRSVRSLQPDLFSGICDKFWKWLDVSTVLHATAMKCNHPLCIATRKSSRSVENMFTVHRY